MSLSPKSPLRADHRYLKKFLGIMLGDKIEFVPEEFDKISRVFIAAGGSWERIFAGGSPKDIELLRKVAKTAFEKGFLTKKNRWGA